MTWPKQPKLVSFEYLILAIMYDVHYLNGIMYILNIFLTYIVCIRTCTFNPVYSHISYISLWRDDIFIFQQITRRMIYDKSFETFKCINTQLSFKCLFIILRKQIFLNAMSCVLFACQYDINLYVQFIVSSFNFCKLFYPIYIP